QRLGVTKGLVAVAAPEAGVQAPRQAVGAAGFEGGPITIVIRDIHKPLLFRAVGFGKKKNLDREFRPAGQWINWNKKPIAPSVEPQRRSARRRVHNFRRAEHLGFVAAN